MQIAITTDEGVQLVAADLISRLESYRFHYLTLYGYLDHLFLHKIPCASLMHALLLDNRVLDAFVKLMSHNPEAATRFTESLDSSIKPEWIDRLIWDISNQYRTDFGIKPDEYITNLMNALKMRSPTFNTKP